MPTVVDLTPQELAELKTLTRKEDDAAAVREAMTEYMRFARRMALKALSGQVEMENNWSVLEDRELRNGHESAGPGPH
jgi:hypothetical protein